MSTTGTTSDPEQQALGDVAMVGRDRVGREISSSSGRGRIDSGDCSRAGPRPQDGAPLLAAANGVRSRTGGQARADTLLASHAEYLRRRAAEVGYSAQVVVPGAAAAAAGPARGAADAGGGRPTTWRASTRTATRCPFMLIGQPVEVRRRERRLGDAAPRPSGHHASGARGPAPAPRIVPEARAWSD